MTIWWDQPVDLDSGPKAGFDGTEASRVGGGRDAGAKDQAARPRSFVREAAPVGGLLGDGSEQKE